MTDDKLPGQSAGAHKRVWEYDGAFTCLDCQAQWGVISSPDKPAPWIMPETCELPGQSAGTPHRQAAYEITARLPNRDSELNRVGAIEEILLKHFPVIPAPSSEAQPWHSSVPPLTSAAPERLGAEQFCTGDWLVYRWPEGSAVFEFAEAFRDASEAGLREQSDKAIKQFTEYAERINDDIRGLREENERLKRLCGEIEDAKNGQIAHLQESNRVMWAEKSTAEASLSALREAQGKIMAMITKCNTGWMSTAVLRENAEVIVRSLPLGPTEEK